MRAGSAFAILLALGACGGKDTPATGTGGTGAGGAGGAGGASDGTGSGDSIDRLPNGWAKPKGPDDTCARFVTRVIHATWPELSRNGATITQADVDTEVTACRTNDDYPRKKDIGCVMAATDDTGILTCIDQLPATSPVDAGVAPADASAPADANVPTSDAGSNPVAPPKR